VCSNKNSGWLPGFTGILLCLFASLGQAAIDFPTLSGRVVDNAAYLNATSEQQISQQLDAYENATGNQLVVATVENLQGYSIEEFAYQLGRHWGIGQKDKNNGVLLLVAKSERKVRIDVGYGLEGVLTDAISANIIHTVILPQFKKGQYASGIANGTTAVIASLGGNYVVKEGRSPERNKSRLLFFLFLFFIGFWPILSMFLPGMSSGRGYSRGYGYGSTGGGFRGGGLGGGFGGGGGSFGGGGASGGW